MLVCMGCNIEYEEDRKFCKYCGDPLVPKVESILKQKKENKAEDEKSDGKIVCPHCKIIYEFGNSCIQCGAPLGHPIPPQTKEAPEMAHPPQGEIESFQVQVLRKQTIEISRKNFICPNCKIIYEHENSCIRCGATLVDQLSLQTKEENKGDQRTEIEGEPLQAQIPQGKQIIVHTQEVKQEFQEVKEKLPETEIPEQKPTKKLSNDLERRLPFPRRRKRDYRRLFLEVGRITIMVVAGGYFLWSIYSHLITKHPESRTPTSKEMTSQMLPSSSASPNPAVTVRESEEFKNKKTEKSSSLSKEVTVAISAPPSISATSKTSFTELQEIEDIKNLLENIRQANLQKNIDLFLSCYSTDFKDREGKRNATLTFWKNFDYLDLLYHLKNPSMSGDTAKSRVEWLIKISSKTGGQPQESKTILDVTFKKEEGGWKIKEVKQGG